MIFVDGVVAEMHARVPQVLPRIVILHRGKPRQAVWVMVLILDDHSELVAHAWRKKVFFDF